MNTFKSMVIAFGVVATMGISACNQDDAANDALKQAGVNGNVNTEGGLPDGFPADLATPDLKLESGIGVEGTYTLRYTSMAAAEDVTAYRGALGEDGFTSTEIVDNSGQPSAGGNVTFTSANDDWSVVVAAFGPDAPGGGNYLAVVVTPV